MRILCVDDSNDICEPLTVMLASSDIEAVAVHGGAEALRLMEGEQFGLYVVDGHLSDVGGLFFCEQVRRVDKTTPVVFFTGNVSEEGREEALRAGATAYIIKPDACALVSAVKRLLEEAPGLAES